MIRTARSSVIEDDDERMDSRQRVVAGPGGGAFSASEQLAHLSAYETACAGGDDGVHPTSFRLHHQLEAMRWSTHGWATPG
jgi:hypothetical protein